MYQKISKIKLNHAKEFLLVVLFVYSIKAFPQELIPTPEAPNSEKPISGIGRVRLISDTSTVDLKSVMPLNFIVPRDKILNCIYLPIGQCDEILAQYYPTGYVKILISSNKLRKELFNVDDISALTKPNILYISDLNRSVLNYTVVNNDEENPTLCNDLIGTHFFKAAENKEGELRWIIQNEAQKGNEFKQGFAVDQCTYSVDKSTNSGGCLLGEWQKTVPSGVVPTCVQKFVYKQMVALHPNGTVYQDEFKVPAYCTCLLRP